jgi:hypothetical protein
VAPEDFEPWRDLIARYPGYTPDYIAGLELIARQRGGTPDKWFSPRTIAA